MNTSIIAVLLTLFLGASPWPLSPEELATISAVDTDPDGRTAWAVPGTKPETSTLFFQESEGGEARSVAVTGDIRAVLVLPDSDAILAIVHRTPRRRPHVTRLQRFSTVDLKDRRLSVLPDTAQGLTLWKGTNQVLVACGKELRSFFVPDFRSGPLYLLPGGNFSMAQVGERPIFLVSRAESLALVNLSDPHGREDLPVRKSVATRTPLRVMVLSDDLTRLHGLTLEGEAVDLPIDWLDLEAAAAPLKPQEPTPPENEIFVAAEPVKEPATESVEQIEPQAAPRTEKVLQPEQEQKPEPASAPEIQQEAQEKPPQEPEPKSVPEIAEEPEPEKIPHVASPPQNHQVGGHLTGPAAGKVQSVVLLGPNSILKEAARTAPGPDGRWGFGAVAPGRYRVVLDGGSDQVVLSTPRYQMITVQAGERIEVPSFVVNQAR